MRSILKDMEITSAVRRAVGALRKISITTAGARGEGAASAALVLAAVEASLEEQRPPSGFLLRRATAGLTAVSGPERLMLARMLKLTEHELGGDSGFGELSALLVEYACELEATRRMPEADAVMALARVVAPGNAELALHAGRIARKQGDAVRALDLYRIARLLEGTESRVGMMASVGEAVTSPNAEAALGRIVRAAMRASDHEVAAVALEERARVRRCRGAKGGAARDLCVAALRFPDPVDRARVAHQLADLFIASGDLAAAGEALLIALSLGDSTQRDHALGRLHTVARDRGDQLGMRRWRSFGRQRLVSLSAVPRGEGRPSAAPRLVRWRDHIEGMIP